MTIGERKCACKGIRQCLMCDANHVAQSRKSPSNNDYVYCLECGDKAIFASQYDAHVERVHRTNEVNHKLNEDYIIVDGVFLQQEVLTNEEEVRLSAYIDSFDWVDSQSGRRKQDFGPKINFKKKKLNLIPFNGLPSLDMQLFEKVKSSLKPHKHSEKFEFEICDFHFPVETNCDNILKNFYTVEVCHLEYCPERGSSIDPHFDDFWIWGERLVTFNLVSSTVITLTEPNRESEPISIRINLPPRSILVLYGDARYKYHHSIKPSDVFSRRLAITFRELPKEFLIKSNENYGKYALEFIEKAQQRID